MPNRNPDENIASHESCTIIGSSSNPPAAILECDPAWRKGAGSAQGAATRLGWPVRFVVYTLILVSAFASMTVRLGMTQREVGQESSPMLSANDRSRWVTVRALVETGSFEIDPYTRHPVLARHWHTIDKVVHPAADGRLREYSSKPPLLATMFAAVYKILRPISGFNFDSELFWTVRTLLLLCQIIPLTVTLAVFARCLDQLPGWSDTSRFLVFAAACWGTFVTTFAVTLNNHHFAVMAVYWSLFALLAIWKSGGRSGTWFVVLGLSAGMAFANELPALAWTVAVLGIGLYLNYQLALRLMVPALLVVMLAYFGTNLIAHRTLKMPYSFRNDGPVLVTMEESFGSELSPGPMPIEMRRELNRHSDKVGFQLGPSTWIEQNRYSLPNSVAERWVIRDYYLLPMQADQWRAVALVRPKGESHWEVRRWENWYDYPGTYWHDDQRKGPDAGEPSVFLYAVHCLVGHHGVFSLTPMWLLSIAGIFLAVQQKGPWQWFAAGVLGLSLVIVGFYLSRPLLDRNYGGQASGLRWLFWLSPFWLIMMLPAVEWLQKFRWGLVAVIVLLIASAGSAQYSGTNPWVEPWPVALWK